MAYSKRKARRRPKVVGDSCGLFWQRKGYWALWYEGPRRPIMSLEDLWNQAEHRLYHPRPGRVVIEHPGFSEVIYPTQIFTTLHGRVPPSTVILE